MNFIPYSRQWIAEDDIKAVTEVLQSDWLTTGPKVTEFEEKLAARVGAAFAVTFSSGTAALHAAYHVAGISKGHEIITSPITFAATANGALYQGAKPVFVDIEPETGLIDTSLIEDAITPETKALVPVDYAGQSVDIAEILEIAGKHNLTVIEDAAHALGAPYGDKPVGSLSDMTIFSFHPVKHIATGEGGAVTTNREDYYHKLIQFRSHGVIREPGALHENHGPWYHEMQDIGFNYRLTDIQCALGISQLAKLDTFLEKRCLVAEKYNNCLSGLKDVALPVTKPNRSHAWHLYVLRVTGENHSRKELYMHLKENDIGSQVHYLPVYLHPYYRQLGYRPGLCPKAEQFYSECLSIPLYPAMAETDVSRVITAVRSY